MKILGFLLIVAGLFGLLYGGFSFTQKEKVIDAGPIEVTRDDTERLPITPLAGGLMLAAGVVLVFRSATASRA